MNPHDDHWGISQQWPKLRTELSERLLAGKYDLSPVDVFYRDSHCLSRWGFVDAVVLKALSIVLDKKLIQPMHLVDCRHVKGAGGHKGAIRSAAKFSKRYDYVFKTDIASFYQSIDHALLFECAGCLSPILSTLYLLPLDLSLIHI